MLEAGACVCRSPEAGVLASHGGQHKKVTVTKEGSTPWLHKLPNCRATQSSISATSCSQIDAHDPAQFELQTHMTYIHTDASKRGHACTDGRALSSTGCATHKRANHAHTYIHIVGLRTTHRSEPRRKSGRKLHRDGRLRKRCRTNRRCLAVDTLKGHSFGNPGLAPKDGCKFVSHLITRPNGRSIIRASKQKTHHTCVLQRRGA